MITETEVEERRPHTRLGIASFVIAALALLILFGGIFRVAWELAQHGTEASHEAAVPGWLLAMIFVSMFMVLVGLLLGLVGVFQSRCRRLYAGLGLGLNAFTVLVFYALYLIGSQKS